MEGLNMIYFRKNDEVIEKYQVDFDKEEIEKLKKEIINNCSFIQHEEYESDYSPRFTDEIIRNFTYTPIEKEKEYFEETRDIYRYSYDEYKPPYLVKLINQLLNNYKKQVELNNLSKSEFVRLQILHLELSKDINTLATERNAIEAELKVYLNIDTPMHFSVQKSDADLNLASIKQDRKSVV